MRLITKYIFLLAALCAVGCSDSFDGGAMLNPAQQGELTFTVSLDEQTRSESMDAILESGVLKVYNSDEKLVRRYTAVTETISDFFAVGNYSLSYSAGKFTPATFDESDKSFSGMSDVVTIAPHETTIVDLEAEMQSSTLSIRYDRESLDSHYEGYYVEAYAVNSDSEITSETPMLRYDLDDDGYFILPEGVTNLVWVLLDSEGVVKQGVIENAEKRHQYQISFKYSDYLELGGLDVKVEEIEDFDDSFDFKVQPVIRANNFNFADSQNYVAGDSYELSITSITPIIEIEVITPDTTYLTYPSNPESVVDGISYEADSKSLVLSGAVFDSISTAGFNDIHIKVVDENGSEGKADMKVGITGFISISDVDFWNNSGKLTGYTTSTEVADVKMRYRYVGEENWSEFVATTTDNHTWRAEITSEWSTDKNAKDLDISTLTRGVTPSKTYECQMVVDSVELPIVEYTTEATTQTLGSYGLLDDANFSCFGDDSDNKNAPFWSSGNNSYTKTLCTQFTYDIDKKGAYLKAKLANYVVIKVFAAGNLYTGTFDMGSTSGTANFGQKFDWQARPKTLDFSYKAKVGSNDKGRVYFAIVDWTERRGVTVTSSSSESNPAVGLWDPETMNSVEQGKIIAYGSLLIPENVDAMTDYKMPIYYYNTDIKPNSNNYSIVISASTSYKGDYAMGSEDSALWLDDFKFGY